MSFFTLLDGTRIGYQRWGKGCTHKILALHGWLDNSNSFSVLGPLLAQHDFDVVAYDHVGHGHSSHIPRGMAMAFPKYVAHAKNVTNLLGWKKPTVIGHSMGAAVSTLLAGCFPDMINKLVLIEMLGPNNGAPEKAAGVLKGAIEAELKYLNKTANPKLYDFQGAVHARIATVAKYPGKQTLSADASRSLIERGTMLANANPGDPFEFTDPKPGDSVRFRHDPRLLLPHYGYMTHDQIMSFINAINAKSLLITGEAGWPFLSPDYLLRPIPMLEKGILEMVTLPGSHHLHIDPDSASVVGKRILAFLGES